MNQINSLRYDNLDFTLEFHSNDDHIAKQVKLFNTFYEIDLLSAITPFLNNKDMVIDIGANVGNHSVFFAGVLGCNVVAFEPYGLSYELLVKNIHANELSSLISPRNCGLGEINSYANISFIDDKNLGATRLSVEQDGQIPIRSLDSYLNEFDSRAALIKIDVEGMELDVIRGALKLIESDHPIIICEAIEEEDFSNVNEELSRLGYSRTEIFNYSASHLFLPKKWSGNGSYSREDYLLDSLERTSRRVRSVWSEQIKDKKTLQELKILVDELRQINEVNGNGNN